MTTPEVRSSFLEQAPPWTLVVTSIFSVQFGSSIARTMFPYLGATGTLLLRLGFSALLLLVIVRPNVRGWTPAAWRAVVVLGLCLGFMNLSFYLALRDVPLGVAVTVEFTGPLLLALVQTRKWLDAVWAALAMAGVALLGLGSTDGVHLTGLVFAFVAGLFWAGYIMASSRVGRHLPGLQGLSMALCVALVIAVIAGGHAVPKLAERPSLLLAGLAVAVLSSIVCYGLEMIALRRMATRVFGILMSIEPAAAALAGFLVLRQLLGPREIAALVMVSVASVGVTFGARPRNRQPTVVD